MQTLVHSRIGFAGLILLASLAVAGLGGCQAVSGGGGGGGGGADQPPADTDNDGLTDAEEIRRGTNPEDADSDDDGLTDGEEIGLGTSPLSRDSDNDGTEDGVDDEPLVPAEDSSGDQDEGDAEPPDEGETDSSIPQDGLVEEIEPNDTFAGATVARLGSATRATLVGSVGLSSDVDVFDLGSFAPGDRLVVEVRNTSRFLDSLIAVFDAEGKLFARNDDHSGSDSLVDEMIRHSGSSYYLAVTHSTVFAGSGNYTIDVEVERGGEAPVGSGQIVFLDFDGGLVDDPFAGTVEMDPFDAGAIDEAYEGQSGPMKGAIVATIQENFEAFDITLFSSDVDAPPEAAHSTVFFGGFNRLVYGVAESVDAYNRDPEDFAIIYTESFTPDQFSEPVGAEALGVAIGNIASHELGHLLGLHHVNDAEALMDTVSPADAFLEDQDFITADLDDEIFPLGVQDAFLLLSEILGLL